MPMYGDRGVIELKMDKAAALDFVRSVDEAQPRCVTEVAGAIQQGISDSTVDARFITCDVPKDQAWTFMHYTQYTDDEAVKRVRNALLRCGEEMAVYNVGPQGEANCTCSTVKEATDLVDGLLCDAPHCDPVMIVPTTMSLQELVDLPEHPGW